MADSRALKILVIGSEGTGRGSIIRQIATPFIVVPQIGMEFYRQDMDGTEVRFWTWVGQNNPRSPMTDYFAGASGGCVIYNARSIHSFEQAKVWIAVLQEDYDIRPVLIVAQYARDERNRVILPQDGEALATATGALYREIDPDQLVAFESALRELVAHVVTTEIVK